MIRDANLKFWRNDTWESCQLYQYDYGQKMRIEGLNLSKGIAEVHYSVEGSPAIVRIGTIEEGILEAPIPDATLKKSGTVIAYIYVTDEDSGQTEYSFKFFIRTRPDTGKDPGDSEDRPISVLIRKIAMGKADGLSLVGSELQLTAEGKPVGNPVTLPAGGAADMKPMTTEEIDNVMEGE